MKAGRRSPNHDLTRNEYVLTAGRGYGRVGVVLAGVIVVLALLVVTVRFLENHLAPESYLSDVRAENRQLRKELAKVNLDLEIERATRGELERQVASLNEQLRQVGEELAFLKSAGVRAPGK